MNKVDPFTTEYLEQEIEFYNPKSYRGEGISLHLKPIKGGGVTRIDEYFNTMFWSDGPDIPILKMDGQIWMSLTWLEVQSHWCVFQDFEGDVLLGGLGMGYAALRLAANPKVRSVTVYEIDERVIKFFNEVHAGRPELEKITIIWKDIHKAAGLFDYCFIDIYQTLLPDALLEDAFMFNRNPPEGLRLTHVPRFWGQELALESAYATLGGDVDLLPSELALLAHWQNHDDKIGLARPIHDTAYCEELADILGRT